MRVTNNMLHMNYLDGVRGSLGKQMKYNMQVTEQRRVLDIDDKPVNITNALSFQNSIDKAAQYQRNITSAQNWLQLADGEVQKITEHVRTAKNEFAVAGSNDALSPEARKALSNDVKALSDEILSLANAKHLDRYIFAGQQTRTKPYEPADQQLTVLRQGSYIGTSGAVLYTKDVYSDLPELERGQYEITINYDNNTGIAELSMRDELGNAMALDSNGSDNSGGGNFNRLSTTARFEANPGDVIDTGRGIAVEIPEGFRDGQRIQFSYEPGDHLAYRGDDNAILTQVGEGDSTQINATGAEMFSRTAKQIETTFRNYSFGKPIKNITLFKNLDGTNIQNGDQIDFSGFDHSGNRIGAARVLSPRTAQLNQVHTSDDQRRLSINMGSDRLDTYAKNVQLPAHSYDDHDRLAFAMQTAINESFSQDNNPPVHFRGGRDIDGNETGPLSPTSAGGTAEANRLFVTGNIAYDQYDQISLKVVEDAVVGSSSSTLKFQIFGFDGKTEYANTAALNSASGSYLGNMSIEDPQVGFKYDVREDGTVSGNDTGLNIGFLAGQALSAGSTLDFVQNNSPEMAFDSTTGVTFSSGSTLAGLNAIAQDALYQGSTPPEQIREITFSAAADVTLGSAGATLNYVGTLEGGGSFSGTVNLGPESFRYPVTLDGTGIALRFDTASGTLPGAVYSGGNTFSIDFAASGAPPEPKVDLTAYNGPGETIMLRARSALSAGGSFAPGNFSSSGTIDFSNSDITGGFFDVMDNQGNVLDTMFIPKDGRAALWNGATIAMDADSQFKVGEMMSFALIPENAVRVEEDGSNLMFETLGTGDDIQMEIFGDPKSTLGFNQNAIQGSGTNTTYSIDVDKPIEDMLKFAERLYGNTIDAYVSEEGKIGFRDKHAGNTLLEVHMETLNQGIAVDRSLGGIHSVGADRINDYMIEGNYSARADSTWRVNLHIDSAAGTNSAIVGRDNGVLLTIEDQYNNKLVEDMPLDAYEDGTGRSLYQGEPLYISDGISIRIPMGTQISNGQNLSEIDFKGNGSLAFGSSATVVDGQGTDVFQRLSALQNALDLDLGKHQIKDPTDWKLGSTAMPAIQGDYQGNSNNRWTFEAVEIYGSADNSQGEIKKAVEHTRQIDLSSADGTLTAYDSATERYRLSAMSTMSISYYDPSSQSEQQAVIDFSRSPGQGIFSSLDEIEQFMNNEIKQIPNAVKNGLEVDFQGEHPGPARFVIQANGNSDINPVLDITYTGSDQYGVVGYDNGLFGRTYAQNDGDTPSHFDFELDYNDFDVAQSTVNVPYKDEVIGLRMQDLTQTGEFIPEAVKNDFSKRYDDTTGQILSRTPAQIVTAIQSSLQQQLEDHFSTTDQGQSPIKVEVNGNGDANNPFQLGFKQDGITMTNLDDTEADLLGLRRHGEGAEFNVYDQNGNQVRRVRVDSANEPVYIRDGVELSMGHGTLQAKDKFDLALGVGAQNEVGTLEQGIDQIISSLTQIGATSSRLEMTDQRYDSTSTTQKGFLTEELGATTVDMIEAASDLEQAKAAYESSLAVQGKMSQLTLLNYI